VACLPRHLTERYGITIVPVNFYTGGRLWRDWIDITPTEAYKLFLEDPDSFRTSAASPEDFIEAYREAARRVPNILCITLSVDLSTTYNSARLAADLVRTELPGVSITVMDSWQATCSEGMVVLAAARAAAEGKSLEEAVAAAEDIRERVQVVMFLDTLKHVYRTGRIPKLASQIGAALNIKPLLTIRHGVHFLGVARSRQRGIDRILRQLHEYAGDRPVHVAVAHAYAPEEAAALCEEIRAWFDAPDLWLAEFSPVMGYATGTGTLGISYYTEP
jgi:DegV family protein with EDD domain